MDVSQQEVIGVTGRLVNFDGASRADGKPWSILKLKVVSAESWDGERVVWDHRRHTVDLFLSPEFDGAGAADALEGLAAEIRERFKGEI